MPTVPPVVFTVSCILPTNTPVTLPVSLQVWPRTKQTARKVTGGSAPRVNLQVLQKKKAKAKAASNKPSLKKPANINSGWWGHVVSEEHMYKVKKLDVKFICVTCHWQKNKNDPKPYFDFYSKEKACPLHSPYNSWRLPAYFPEGDYNFSQLPFNLGTPESMEAYEQEASHLANTLCAYSKVVLFLTTHSDEDRGDLFIGYINNKPVASKTLEFLQLLLSPLSKVVDGADIIFYLACTVPYLQSLLDNTIIQGFPVSSAARVALNDCGMLGRHSNIILVMWQEEALVVEKFLWTDKHLKPWVTSYQSSVPSVGQFRSG
ncbi:hypothetical protein EDC04DRAFT_2615237 [Pisolithus marmoratus]|nr:hypothetical protein EDC04DRAFT_2615237 [Pisolithus marmoratus]